MKLIFKLFGAMSLLVMPTMGKSASIHQGGYIGAESQTNFSTPSFAAQKQLNLDAYNAFNTSKNSPAATLNLGYNRLITNTSMDLDLGGFISSPPKNHVGITTSKTTTTSPIATVSSNPFSKVILSSQTITTFNHFEYGADLRPGVARWFDSLIYGRVGVGFNKASLTINNQLAINHSNFGLNLPVNTMLNSSTDKNIAGLRLGIGLEKQMGTHVALFVDYIHTNYGRLNTQKTSDGFAAQPMPGFAYVLPSTIKNAFSTQAEPSFSINQVFLGLRYYFA